MYNKKYEERYNKDEDGKETAVNIEMNISDKYVDVKFLKYSI